MTAPAHAHDHDHEIAMFGLCLTCADAGMGDAAQNPAPTQQLRFDGETFDADLDQGRLGQQMLDVLAVIRDGRWHSLAEISQQTGHPEASVSARLRDLRKARFGGHRVERRRSGAQAGTHEYRIGHG